MENSAIKDFMYGGIQELMHNRKYYYYSSVGVNYSHWTDEGEKALSEFMNIMTHKMMEAKEAEIRKKAKEMVIEGLKGETT